jgi:colanic acid biosynthesis glycosyl transferase WcaI
MTDLRRPTLWVTSELYYPELTSTGYFLTGIAEGLAESFRVRVICAQPTYAGVGTRAPDFEHRSGVDIERCWSTRFSKDRLLLRALNASTIAIGIFVRLVLRARRGDVILVVTNPPLLPYAATVAARMRGARIVVLVHDMYPELLSALGLVSPRSAVWRVADGVSRLLYQSADRIVVLGRDMASVVRDKLRGNLDKLSIIPNWGDIDTILARPAGTSILRTEMNLQHAFVVEHLGNMGRSHDVPLLAGAARLLSDDSSIRFLFVGAGAQRHRLEQEARTTSSIILQPPCPAEMLSDTLNACDVAVIAFRPGMYGISVPSRLYSIMAAGKPVIAVADERSELALVVREERIGWVVPPGDLECLVRSIRDAMADPRELAAMGDRARAAAEASYTQPQVIRRYHELLKSVMATDQPDPNGPES